MKVRELTLWACDTFLPNTVFFPQTSQTRAIASPGADRLVDARFQEMPRNPKGRSHPCQARSASVAFGFWLPIFALASEPEGPDNPDGDVTDRVAVEGVREA